MPEHLLHHPQVRAPLAARALEQVGARRVAQQVRAARAARRAQGPR